MFKIETYLYCIWMCVHSYVYLIGKVQIEK